jgi:hypothetical protein
VREVRELLLQAAKDDGPLADILDLRCVRGPGSPAAETRDLGRAFACKSLLSFAVLSAVESSLTHPPLRLLC